MAHVSMHPAARGLLTGQAARAALPPLSVRLRNQHAAVFSTSTHGSQAILQDTWPQGTQQLQQQQHLDQQQQQQHGDLQGAASPLVDDWLQRSRLLVGADGLARLAALNVLLVGLGGVGSFAAEFLCRAGVGSMTLVDGDSIDTTNRNRQLPALASTVGQLKTGVVAGRLRDINPDIQLTVHQEFLDPDRASALVEAQPYDYVIDCIDSVAPKQALLLAGHTAGIPTISSMGAGGRLDPARVRLADISATHNDAFAAVVRKRLRKAGVSSGITVVFSDEPAAPASLALTQQQYKRSYFGTCSYIPALFGLYIASHVIRQTVEPGYALPKPPSSSSSSKAQGRKAKKGKGGSRGESSRSSRSASSSGSSRGANSSGSSSGWDATSSCGCSSIDSSADEATPGAAASSLFASYQASQGVGMGLDGDGL